jgi:RNA polymerase sigma-70 factor (ECF subfamily)
MSAKKTGKIDLATIELAKSGDEEAVSMIFDKYRNYLMAIANQRLESSLARRVSPSDIVQETAAALTQSMGSFAGNSEQELKAWLRASLCNTLKNAQRFHLQDKRSVSNETEFPSNRFEDLSTPSKQMRAVERRTLIESGLKSLSDKDQRVLRLRHEEGLSFVEIGKKLGVSSDAARMTWGRAIEKLKTHLSTHGGL